MPRPAREVSSSTAGLVIIFALMMLVGTSNIILFHKVYLHRQSSHDVQTNEFVKQIMNELQTDRQEEKEFVEEDAAVDTSAEDTTQDTPQDTPVKKSKHKAINENTADHHPIAGLNCQDHGGPSDPSEMIYWNDIPSDSKYISPFYNEEKYITFEPDAGGFNNIRMAYETIFVLAHATGRTLVLPPEKQMYLLSKGGSKHKKDFTFNDFFHLDSIAFEHAGINIITMEEFLKRKGVSGQLKDLTSGTVIKPPNDQTNWNGKNLNPLFDYLRKVGKFPEGWNPNECIAAMPSNQDPKNVQELHEIFDDIQSLKYGPIPDPLKDFVNEPVDVDGSVKDRMREMLATRKNLCVYDEELQREPLLHFKVDHAVKARMLTHFYAFIFFQDWKQDLFYKRFVRDHIRYVDEIVCASARIVDAVRERSRKHSHSNTEGLYDSWHVRRGDFQYKNVKVDVDQLDKQSKDELKDGPMSLYIATDERDKSFFEPLKKKYDVMFLDDFMHLIEGVNPNYYGMLDQLVAYKGRVFFGTWFSTLSGYINRMRGYYSVKAQLEGYELGTLPSYYFVPKDKKFQMTKYMPVKLPIYMREFPTSWRDIDKSL